MALSNAERQKRHRERVKAKLAMLAPPAADDGDDWVEMALAPDGTTHQGRTPAHWRHVALVVAKRTGHVVGLDTATRMLMARDPPPPPESTDGDLDAEVDRLLGR